jgi:phage gpG-like protein
VPSDKAERKDSNEPSNAMLAYIHDNGSPAQNIPARPFMRPGIESAKGAIEAVMKLGAKKALDGDETAVVVSLHQAGLIAQRSIRARINEGIDPPLAESTLRARARKGAKGTKPLIRTGQLRNSINYVIVEK